MRMGGLKPHNRANVAPTFWKKGQWKKRCDLVENTMVDMGAHELELQIIWKVIFQSSIKLK